MEYIVNVCPWLEFIMGGGGISLGVRPIPVFAYAEHPRCWKAFSLWIYADECQHLFIHGIGHVLGYPLSWVYVICWDFHHIRAVLLKYGSELEIHFPCLCSLHDVYMCYAQWGVHEEICI